MSGAAPAIDDSGETSPSNDAFLAVGNGAFNGSTEFGETVLALHYPAGGMLNVVGSYTPNAWQTLNNGTGGAMGTGINLNLPTPYPSGATAIGQQDFDLGSGGVTLARPQGFTLPSDNFVVLAGGKEGVFYVNSPSTMIANITSNHGAADSADACSSGGDIFACPMLFRDAAATVRSHAGLPSPLYNLPVRVQRTRLRQSRKLGVLGG